MTVLIPSRPFPLPERTPGGIVKEFDAQSSPPAADAETRRLTAAIGRGDEAAFRELYDNYRERLFRFALVLARGDDSLAQEAVQSAFVVAARKLRRLETREHLWNWLARVTRQQLAKARRQSQRDPAIVGVADLPELAGAGQADSLLEENLDAALLALTPEERQLVEWFYFDRLSHKEIAERLNATAKAVSSRLERARARLRGLLTERLSHEQ